jgi:transposase
MIHITAQMRVLVAIEAVDGRKGIDSLVRVCQERLSEDPISGCVFIFRSRRGMPVEPASRNRNRKGFLASDAKS